MAYSASILAEAQEMYFGGTSAARIAAELKKRHPEACARICEKTVEKWISRPDPLTKHTWVEKKAQVQLAAEGKRMDKSATTIGKLHGMLDEMIAIQAARVRKSADQLGTSPDYSVQVWDFLVRHRESTLQAVPVPGAITGEHVQILFEVIQADPDVGPIFERRQADLLKTYQERCRAAGLEK